MSNKVLLGKYGWAERYFMMTTMVWVAPGKTVDDLDTFHIKRYQIKPRHENDGKEPVRQACDQTPLLI